MADEPKLPLPFLIAPGREPDDFDQIMAKVRENTTVYAPTKPCRRCGREQGRGGYAKNEFAKERPMCLACAAAPFQAAPGWVREADAAPAPTKPLTAFLAYRQGIAEAEAAEEAAYYLGKIEEDEDTA